MWSSWNFNGIPFGATPAVLAFAVPPLGGLSFQFEGVAGTANGEILGRFTNAGAVQAARLIDDPNPSWIVESVASDISGNVYIAGRSNTTFHFDVNTTGWGVYVARYAPNFTLAWAKFYKGWLEYTSVSGVVEDGSQIDISNNTIGLLAPIGDVADFGVTKIIPKQNATAYAIARLATTDGSGQAAVGAYSTQFWDSTSRAGGIAFGVNGSLVIALRPQVEIEGTSYPVGVVYAGFDTQLQTLWTKQFTGGFPIGLGSNPMQQNVVIAGHAYQSIDFGLGGLPAGGFVVGLGAP